jgi:hypothetical protein
MEQLKLPKSCCVKLVQLGDGDRGRGAESGLDFEGMTVALEVVQAVIGRLPSGQALRVGRKQLLQNKKLTHQADCFRSRKSTAPLAKELSPRIQACEKLRQSICRPDLGCGSNDICADRGKQVASAAVLQRQDEKRAGLVGYGAQSHPAKLEESLGRRRRL